MPRFVSQQVYLSLQERSAEYEIVPSALDQGLGLLIWSPLAAGLSGLAKLFPSLPHPHGAVPGALLGAALVVAAGESGLLALPGRRPPRRG